MRRFLALVVVLLTLAITSCGCGRTPAQTFDETHGGKTVTPYGTVIKGSAQDMADGTVQYNTEDGRMWKVKPVPGDGYGTPQEVNVQ